MSKDYAIQKLFDAVKTSNQDCANKVLKEAKYEFELASKIGHITSNGKESLRQIKIIIEAVSRNRIRDVKNKYSKAEVDFNNHVVGYLKDKINEVKEVQKLPKDVSDEHQGQEEQRKGHQPYDHANYSNDKPKGEPIRQNTENDENKKQDYDDEFRQSELHERKTSTNEETFNRRNSADTTDNKLERSKLASFRMRQNNPDIADLSDPNRPTKIAERFSELYDNEWTEAFEELSKRSRKESEAIEILLTVVTEAYKFCTVEAEIQIKDITKHWNAIFEIGPDKYKNEVFIPLYNKFQIPSSKSLNASKDGESLIIQYRKKIASKALQRLKMEFTKRKMTHITGKAKLPAAPEAFTKYAQKAVELTWWMCVQDPPIFLCPPTEDEVFDKNLYKAYTKTGTKPQFFVWPALRLHEKGGVLIKGVVQFE
ncbi:uncharacterized protein LOC132741416 [Ruditapes philippinarum]|uniref:uncharacterized protein LOC132741416 n=1 Tax=Ruditapes philippinarum TaxID=129788 RepID=UPI00295B4C4C|nr:uncharacterized protein LOC132741416 [Ruditapes philippinarum]